MDDVAEDEVSPMTHKDEAVEDTLASGLVTERTSDGHQHGDIAPFFFGFSIDPWYGFFQSSDSLTAMVKNRSSNL